MSNDSLFAFGRTHTGISFYGTVRTTILMRDVLFLKGTSLLMKIQHCLIAGIMKKRFHNPFNKIIGIKSPLKQTILNLLRMKTSGLMAGIKIYLASVKLKAIGNWESVFSFEPCSS